MYRKLSSNAGLCVHIYITRSEIVQQRFECSERAEAVEVRWDGDIDQDLNDNNERIVTFIVM